MSHDNRIRELVELVGLCGGPPDNSGRETLFVRLRWRVRRRFDQVAGLDRPIPWAPTSAWSCVGHHPGDEFRDQILLPDRLCLRAFRLNDLYLRLQNRSRPGWDGFERVFHY